MNNNHEEILCKAIDILKRRSKRPYIYRDEALDVWTKLEAYIEDVREAHIWALGEIDD